MGRRRVGGFSGALIALLVAVSAAVGVVPAAAVPAMSASAPAWAAAGLEVKIHDGAAVVTVPEHRIELGLRPIAFGWAGHTQPVGRALAVTALDGRSTADHGVVEAWYERRSGGVEQGFTVPRPPAGEGARLRLVQELDAGDLVPVPVGDDGLHLVDVDGVPRISYDHLAVWDAAGRTLMAELSVEPEGVVIEVDAQGASYPVTIDPLIAVVDQRLLPETPGTTEVTDDSMRGDAFGYVMDLSGDTLAVGAPGEDTGNGEAGAVYVYRRQGTDWVIEAKLVGRHPGVPGTATTALGGSVAVDGNLLVAAADGHALVWQRSPGGTWTLLDVIARRFAHVPTLLGESTRVSEHDAVAVDGDVVVVGSPGDDVHGENSGAVHVYRVHDGVVVPEATLYAGSVGGGPADEAVAGALFGFVVAVDARGDILAGAPGKEEPSPGGVGGTVHVWRSSQGSWSVVQRLVAATAPGAPQDGDLFGSSIATDGDLLVVGDPGRLRDPSTPDEFVDRRDRPGAVWIFQLDTAGAWAFQQRLLPPGNEEYGNFGFGQRVDLDRQRVYVLAQQEGSVRNVFSLWERSRVDGSWTRMATFSDVWASVFGDTHAALADTGGLQVRVLVRDGGGGLQLQDTVVAQRLPQGTAFAGVDGMRFGAELATSGDVLVVGTPGDVEGVSRLSHRPGSATVYHRDPNGRWALVQVLRMPIDVRNDHTHFGASVAISGDRIAVGAPNDFNIAGGLVTTFVRQGERWAMESVFSAPFPTGAPEGRNFGSDLALQGDRLAVAATRASAGGTVFVYNRSPQGWGEPARIDLPAGSAGAGLGVVLHGDLLMVGAPNTAEGYGAALEYQLVVGTWTRTATITKAGSTFFGATLDLYGDTLAVGESFQPRVTIFQRDAQGRFVERQELPLPPGHSQRFYGLDLDLAGDVLAVTDQPAARLYRRDEAGTWSLSESVEPRNPATGALEGRGEIAAVAVSDHDIVLGVPEFAAHGAVYALATADAPTPTPDTATVPQDAGATTIDVLANDTADPRVHVVAVTEPANGTAAIGGEGRSVVYAPPAGFCTTRDAGGTPESFTYTVTGGAQAEVSVRVACPVVPADVAVTVAQDASATQVPVLDADSDPDGQATVLTVGQPANGTAAIGGDGRSVVYTPPAGFCTARDAGGTPESFAYTVSGGAQAYVTVTVSCPSNDPRPAEPQPTEQPGDPGDDVVVLEPGEQEPHDPVVLSGGDNVARAIAWTRVAFPPGRSFAQAGRPDVVLLGRDDLYADSLSSGGAQGLLAAPLLLTGPAALDDRVGEELARLSPDRVLLLGGPAALSAAVADELRIAGYRVERLGGASRIETAAVVAAVLAPTADTAVIARAQSSSPHDPTQGFADSLAGGALAAELRAPLLLTQTEELSPATAAYLEDARVSRVVVVGGPGAVGRPVVEALRALGIDVQRLAGDDRARTATAIARGRGAATAEDAERTILVDGWHQDAWADAFPAALSAGAGRIPLVLSNGGDVPPPTSSYLRGGGGPLTCGTTVTPAACSSAQALLGGASG